MSLNYRAWKVSTSKILSTFCRQYNPSIGTVDTCAYRHGIGRYEHHTSAEVDSVFKDFQRAGSAPTFDTIDAGNGFPSRDGQENSLAKTEHWQKGGTPDECQNLS